MHDLDSCRPIVLHVARQVDCSHPARADFSFDDVLLSDSLFESFQDFSTVRHQSSFRETLEVMAGSSDML